MVLDYRQLRKAHVMFKAIVVAAAGLVVFGAATFAQELPGCDGGDQTIGGTVKAIKTGDGGASIIDAEDFDSCAVAWLEAKPELLGDCAAGKSFTAEGKVEYYMDEAPYLVVKKIACR
jgi:hypothetical protein